MFLVHARVVAKSAFHRAAGIVVLHAEPHVVHKITVIALGDYLHLHDAARGEENLADTVGEVEDVGCLLEELVDVLEHGIGEFAIE